MLITIIYIMVSCIIVTFITLVYLIIVNKSPSCGSDELLELAFRDLPCQASEVPTFRECFIQDARDSTLRGRFLEVRSLFFWRGWGAGLGVVGRWCCQLGGCPSPRVVHNEARERWLLWRSTHLGDLLTQGPVLLRRWSLDWRILH